MFALSAPKGKYDIIVVDRTLHMLGEADWIAALRLLLNYVAPGGSVLIADERENIHSFEAVFRGIRG